MGDEQRWTNADWAEFLGVSKRTIQRRRREPAWAGYLRRPPGMLDLVAMELDGLDVRGVCRRLFPMRIIVDGGAMARELQRRGWTRMQFAGATGEPGLLFRDIIPTGDDIDWRAVAESILESAEEGYPMPEGYEVYHYTDELGGTYESPHLHDTTDDLRDAQRQVRKRGGYLRRVSDGAEWDPGTEQWFGDEGPL